jgi:hypothetical protein
MSPLRPPSPAFEREAGDVAERVAQRRAALVVDQLARDDRGGLRDVALLERQHCRCASGPGR